MILSTLVLSALSLTACSDDHFAGDPEKDWTVTTEYFTPTEEAGYTTYWKPAIGRVGDPMPFYDTKAGEFKVLYLQEFDNNDRWCYHPIYGVSTADGATYQGLGEVLPTGASQYELDAALGTGCAVYNEKDGLYYIYYTGHTTREVVMRATSPDFKTWTKDRVWLINGADYGYSEVDFRDPQVFQDENGLWHMIISSKLKFAEFTSTDLREWSHAGQFSCMIWDRMLECPDIFKMGDWWYMIYSEAYRSDWSRKVKYMMAPTLDELKKCFNEGPKWPADDKEGVLDTRAFYAAKSASNGTDRLIWGWSPYRTGTSIHDKNVAVGAEGEPNWSGALVCHKLVQHADGTLSVGEVPAMAAKYDKPAEVKVMSSDNYASGAIQGEGYVLFNRLGYHNHISFTLTTAGEGDKWGVSFARGTDATKYYSLVVNPEWANGRRKVNFEQEGAEGKGFIVGADGYIFPRPADNRYQVDIYTDNSVVVMYINGEYGTTQRIYGLQQNCWSINSYGGNVTIDNVKVTQY